jgi:hypothetical protein
VTFAQEDKPPLGPVATAAVLGAVGYARTTGLDKKVLSSGKSFIDQHKNGAKDDPSVPNN